MTHYIYFGTYTQNWPDRSHRREGILIYTFEPASGSLQFSSAVMDVTNPSFLAMHPDHQFFYCVNEGEGLISAFSVNQMDGSLTFLNQQPTDGTSPCYLCFDPEAKWILVSNFGTGSLAVFPILPDGRLGPHTGFVEHHKNGVDSAQQAQAHAHSVIFDPTGQYALAADLGIDQVLIYRFDRENGVLIPNIPSGIDLPHGSGPRHMAFHPNLSTFYLANELNSTVVACEWAPDHGILTPFQTLSTLPDDWEGKSYVADIHLTPSGEYLYVSNRGHHSLACYRVTTNGSLEVLGHVSTGGEWPRNFAILPDGKNLLVANERSSNVVAFKIPSDQGIPVASGQVISVPKPVCVLPVIM